MKSILFRARQYLLQVCSAAHTSVEAMLVDECMKVVVLIYLEGLFNSKIPTEVGTIVQILVQDEVTYAEFFAKEFSKTTAETEKYVESLSKVRTMVEAQSPMELVPNVTAVLVNSFGPEVATRLVEGVICWSSANPTRRCLLGRCNQI